MTIWSDAGGVIRAAFVDPEQIIYSGAGLVAAPISAIRSDRSAPDFAGPGGTLRTIAYEVAQADLPEEPTKRDTFTHRGRRWLVEDITRLDDVGAWELIVVDGGFE